ncbi:MAG: hypothetical protein FJZ43_01755 [Candidatus Staskawiczbacteria bacterium]|nr:hypothetical protein [Candidatus Staskawiczbacteria bacterium]
MNKNIVIVLILVLALLVGGYFLFVGNTQVPVQDNNQTNNEPINNPDNTPKEDDTIPENSTTTKTYEIIYTDNGYSPNEINIKVGDTVTFKNESSRNVWTASAMHPSHTVYAGTSLQQHCSQETNEAFDECKDSKPGESWSFTFKKAGTWGYHNHSFANHFGKIIVE